MIHDFLVGKPLSEYLKAYLSAMYCYFWKIMNQLLKC